MIPRKQSNKTGVSLLELTAVVAMIGILAGIVLPRLAAAAKDAQSSRLGDLLQALPAIRQCLMLGTSPDYSPQTTPVPLTNWFTSGILANASGFVTNGTLVIRQLPANKFPAGITYLEFTGNEYIINGVAYETRAAAVAALATP